MKSPRSAIFAPQSTSSVAVMDFKETFSAEVYRSRMIRSQRALFWAKVTGFLLVLSVGASMRVEPALRTAVANAGMSAMETVFYMRKPDRINPKVALAQPGTPTTSVALEVADDAITQRAEVQRPLVSANLTPTGTADP